MTLPADAVVNRCIGRDAAALSAFARDTYAEHYADYWTPRGLDRFLSREFDLDAMRVEIGRASAHYLTVEVSGRLAGYAKWKFAAPWSTGGEGMVEVSKMYFAQWATGRGLGEMLMRRIRLDASACGATALWLHVLKINEGAVRAYQRYGFGMLGERPYEMDGKEVGMWIMLRRLCG